MISKVFFLLVRVDFLKVTRRKLLFEQKKRRKDKQLYFSCLKNLFILKSEEIFGFNL